MQPAKKIRTIPATIGRQSDDLFAQVAKKRVAAYARVSTDDDVQLNSYEAQVDHYTRHITSNASWEFVKVYADEGITGTNTKKREGFNQMVEDALDGKIDLIITKSVSRFARNTVDSIVTVRKLKEKGVEVYFEKENIYTLDSKGELMLTIMSSLAQEESRSISDNTTWGMRKRMQDGKFTIAYKHFLGYTRGEDGAPAILESEAAIVRQIYDAFLNGKTYREIAHCLTEQAVPTPTGKTIWQLTTIRSILSNEKYSGNAILQKSFTVDFLSKSIKVNEGEVPQYFVENSHPAIISLGTFEMVQEEIRRRKSIGKKLRSVGRFACRLICGDCGSFYGSKVWDSNNKHRRTVWQCNRKYQNEKTCQTPHLTEEDIQTAFISAFNRLVADRDRYIAEYTATIAALSNTAAFDEQTARLEMECGEAAMQAQDYVNQNAKTAQNQEEYNREFAALTASFNAAKAQLEAVRRKKVEQVVHREKTQRFLALLEQTAEPLTDFDEQLWQSTVDSVVVRTTDDIMVVFRSGTEIQVDKTQ